MKIFHLFLFLPVLSFAQEQSCNKTALLYSRELFPGEVTVARTVALAGFETDCQDTIAAQPALVKVAPKLIDTYQFYPIDARHQDLFGQERSLDVDTEQLVNHLVFDRK